MINRGIGVGFEGDLAAPAETFVGRYDDGGFRILDAAGERLRREAAEHDRMNRTNPCAGEHRVCGLGDHRQIDRDAVTLLDAAALEHVGETAHPAVQLWVGDALVVLGVVTFPDNGDPMASLRELRIRISRRTLVGQ